MEKDKQKYLEALRQNEGKEDEIDVGKSLGFTKEYTDKLIEALMAEEKITYYAGNTCNYKVVE
ncbi:hypothetical protein [Pontibacter kalidii]|uniref:hypothetical protein n=1 Tax=Pontibacter kalidii TaxID=2592049 RepID=UPI00225262F6|nr:hypothetical protein [Pontibacter kalidii]